MKRETYKFISKVIFFLLPVAFPIVIGSLSPTASAQAPQKMSYQAVIRNASNALVVSHSVGMKISILQGSSSGSAVYEETHTPTTNANGLATIEIGGGTIVTGTFAGIDWSTGTYFIKTETDPAGGSSYTITGTSQLLSVPYALYAKNAGTSDALQSQINMLKISSAAGGTITDVENNTYNIVKIGTQVWMSENLKTTKYSNGDLIGTTTPTTLDITSESTPKYQWAYAGNESNVNTYGRLYTWYAVTDSRNVCPTGWHVPTDAEWTVLTDYLTSNGYGYQGSGTDIAKSMAATSGWTASATAGAVGNDQASNNTRGFTALPGGYRYYNGTYYTFGDYGYWWSSAEFSTANAYGRFMGYHDGNVTIYNDIKNYGFSVRCLKD